MAIIEPMGLALITYPRINPVIFRLGPFAVRWYGVAYLTGFAIGYAVLRQMIRRGTLRLAPDALGDLVAWMAGGVIIGGRAGWWLVYHRSMGAIEPWWEPVAIWHGGMSFHGGLIGVFLALLIWSWRNRVPFLNLADCLALVTPFGLFFGRIANFINGELVGRKVEASWVSWGMIFPGDNFARHPSQLYEAFLEGPLMLAILWAVWKWKTPAEGRIGALFVILYGVFRFAVEFTREPDSQLGFIAFGWLTMGQLLSVALTGAGVVLWFVAARSRGPSRGKGFPLDGA
jgi:phosphatidylglycerol:prolipoprotein diacylglycerol transferase